MESLCARVRAGLLARREEEYRRFQSGLMPTVPAERVLGVRAPVLRAMARELKNDPALEEFLHALPHDYYEENTLHGYLIAQMREFDACLAALDAFLPYVDNWATCDSMQPVCFKKNTARLGEPVARWLAAEHTYTVRFGLGTLMAQFLDDAFAPGVLDRAGAVRSGEYYVQMMQAWLFATALAKQWDATLPWLTERRLPRWVHNKTIQKAIESRRIPPGRKQYLRTLRQS